MSRVHDGTRKSTIKKTKIIARDVGKWVASSEGLKAIEETLKRAGEAVEKLNNEAYVDLSGPRRRITL